LTKSSLRVDFYVLPATEVGARLHFTCRLTEKAYGLNHRTYVHTDSAAEVRQLDELLWTFRAGSFVPHETEDAETGADIAPIVIGHNEQTDAKGDLLINLASAIPPFFDRFSRVAEIVDGTPEGRNLGRERFSFYRDNGYEPNTHNIG